MASERRSISLGAAFALLAALLAAAPARAAEAYVLIRSSQNRTASLTHKQLRALILGEQPEWDGGAGPVELVLHDAAGPDEEHFAGVFSVPVPTFRAKLRQAVFRGDLRRPHQVGTDEEAIAKVRQHAGAIAVIRAASMSGAAGVAVLQVR